MPPLPKKKHTRARKGGRAAHHALTKPILAMCQRCNSAKLPHRMCPVCGFYKGRAVLENVAETGSPEDESTATN